MTKHKTGGYLIDGKVYINVDVITDFISDFDKRSKKILLEVRDQQAESGELTYREATSIAMDQYKSYHAYSKDLLKAIKNLFSDIHEYFEVKNGKEN